MTVCMYVYVCYVCMCFKALFCRGSCRLRGMYRLSLGMGLVVGADDRGLFHLLNAALGDTTTMIAIC